MGGLGATNQLEKSPAVGRLGARLAAKYPILY